jgi:hypothetical protein
MNSFNTMNCLIYFSQLQKALSQHIKAILKKLMNLIVEDVFYMITLGQTIFDHNSQMIELTNCFCMVISLANGTNKQLITFTVITLTVITLSGVKCIYRSLPS